MKTNIKICFFADIHYGQHRLRPDKIYADFHKFVYPYLNDELDILCIGGDFFHILLDMSSQYGFYVTLLINELIELAFKHDFYIRVIRGTFSHDRNQSQMFVTLPKYKSIQKDNERIKYFNSLALEYIKKYDLWFLYKPDDINMNNIYSKIYKLLKENSIDKVDIFMNHGYFKHMLPDVIKDKEQSLDYELIKKYIKGVVLNGHVHQPSIYEKVISSGSFERFAFNEEENKGFFIINYNKRTNNIDYKFIINKDALIFKTLDLLDITDEKEILKLYKKYIKQFIGHKDKIFLNILTTNNTLLYVFKKIASEFNLNINITKSANKQNITEIEEIQINTIDLPLLTKDNICDYIHEFVLNKFSIKLYKDEIKKLIA